ncbi:MAG: hypothetical protein ABI763_11270 [Bacteroidota bacterium]
MSDVQVPLLPTHYYHIYNHAIGKENIFERDQDYHYFLDKIEPHILPICILLAYCLMPNHYHFVVQIKSTAEVSDFFESKLGLEKFNRKKITNEDFITNQISQQFSNLFNTYAKHYNFHRRRMGSLFKRNFRRTEITSTDYLKNVICYVHQNPVEAGFVKSMSDWKYSSYLTFQSNQLTHVAREETLELFGGKKNFDAYHEARCDLG